MNRIGFMISVLTAACCQHAFAQRDILFSQGWDFGMGASKPVEWTQVDLPHDFSMMPVHCDTVETIGPFTPASEGRVHTGYVRGGTGWYRKQFAISPSNASKSVILDFDGAYMEATVWINGALALEHKYGYTPFYVDATPYLNAPGSQNEVVVRVDNIGANSRWYSGSGIYRNVRMHLVPKVRLAQWGINIDTPMMESNPGDVKIEALLLNQLATPQNGNLEVQILNSKGSVVAQSKNPVTLEPGETRQYVNLTVNKPKLWDTEKPNLYTAVVSIKTPAGDDTYLQPFGFRKLEYSAQDGFKLNGKPTLLRGGCLHHDNGFLGAAAIKAAEYRRVKLMKDNGYNAIRCSHNPPSREFLEACDSLGVMVIDEFVDMWQHYKNPNDYSRHFNAHWQEDLESMLLRDRNHPSIVMWSIGNEIPAASGQEIQETAAHLVEYVHKFDTSRPITQGVPSFLVQGGWAKSEPYFSNLDICGYNYLSHKYESDHQAYPERIMYASESYPRDSYQYWKAVENYPWVIGDFVWTAMDYIGEVAVGHSEYVTELSKRLGLQDRDGLPEGTVPEQLFDLMNSMMPNKWPLYQSGCGDIDIIGHKKPQGMYRDVIWGMSPIEMVVHEPIPDGKLEEITAWGWPREFESWTWRGQEGKPMQVRVFSAAPRIRLLLNGNVIDEKPQGEALITMFEVPYAEGALVAQALDDSGTVLAQKELRTHGIPAKIEVLASTNALKADRNDLAFLDIRLLDQDGNLTVADDRLFEISIEGPGQLAATGNANPLGMADVNQEALHTYQGQAQAIIRPYTEHGTVTVTVKSENLPAAILNLEVR